MYINLQSDNLSKKEKHILYTLIVNKQEQITEKHGDSFNKEDGFITGNTLEDFIIPKKNEIKDENGVVTEITLSHVLYPWVRNNGKELRFGVIENNLFLDGGFSEIYRVNHMFFLDEKRPDSILQFKESKPRIAKIINGQKLNVNSLKLEANFTQSMDNLHSKKMFIPADKSNSYTIMRYIEGEELFSYLKAQYPINKDGNFVEGTITLSERLELWKKILVELDKLHRPQVYGLKRIDGIVHADIKPENIIYGINKDINIIDFGSSKKTSENNAGKSAKSGTVSIQSPEQVNNLNLNEKTDLYSATISIFYELFFSQSAMFREQKINNTRQIINFIKIKETRSILEKYTSDLRGIDEQIKEGAYEDSLLDLKNAIQEDIEPVFGKKNTDYLASLNYDIDKFITELNKQLDTLRATPPIFETTNNLLKHFFKQDYQDSTAEKFNAFAENIALIAYQAAKEAPEERASVPEMIEATDQLLAWLARIEQSAATNNSDEEKMTLMDSLSVSSSENYSDSAAIKQSGEYGRIFTSPLSLVTEHALPEQSPSYSSPT